MIFVVEGEGEKITGNFLDLEFPEYMKKAVQVDYVYDVELNKG